MINAIFRRILWILTLGAYKIKEGTEDSMVSSAAAVKASYEEDIRHFREELKKLTSAIAGVETVIEQKAAQLNALNEREEKLLKLQKGAAIKVSKARKADATKVAEQFAKRFNELKREIAEVEQRQTDLEAQIKGNEESLHGYYILAKQQQRMIEKLQSEKHEMASDVEANKQIAEMQSQLAGIGQSTYESKAEIIRRKNRELTAKKNVVGKLVNANATVEDEALLAEIDGLGGNDELEAMIAGLDGGTSVADEPVKEAERPDLGA